jgi:hypothetical protein
MKDSTGTVPVGGKWEGTNTQPLQITPIIAAADGTEVVVTGTVTKNSETAVEGNIESVSFIGSGPEGTFGSSLGNTKVTAKKLPWCFRATNLMAADEFQIRGGSCSEVSRSMELSLDTALGGECSYTRSAALQGTFSTGPGGEFSVSSQEFVKSAGGILCPSSIKGDWKWDYWTHGHRTSHYQIYFS